MCATLGSLLSWQLATLRRGRMRWATRQAVLPCPQGSHDVSGMCTTHTHPPRHSLAGAGKVDRKQCIQVTQPCVMRPWLLSFAYRSHS